MLNKKYMISTQRTEKSDFFYNRYGKDVTDPDNLKVVHEKILKDLGL